MRLSSAHYSSVPTGSLLQRLASDRSGNTMAIVAASVAPILALLGGGIDMGRSYLSESRLQAACDAGVLAARKKLGARVPTDGQLPDDALQAGNSFFDVNFKDGAYGSTGRSFAMTLENDMAVTAKASVIVPTTIMKIFGDDEVPVTAECQARLNYTNTDIMMVLDTTGSMGDTNAGDSESKISALRRVVKEFATTIEASKQPGTRVRYGFVPYSTNVNVGNLLKSDWLVDKWTYQSRESVPINSYTASYWYAYYELIGGNTEYIAPYKSDTCPADTVTVVYSPTTYINEKKFWFSSMFNGIKYYCSFRDGQYDVSGIKYNDYNSKVTYEWAFDKTEWNYEYIYGPMQHDVTKFKGATGDDPPHNDFLNTKITNPPDPKTPSTHQEWYTGCIEERQTYEIDDYANVDLSRALDLDLDLVPTPGNPETQWRPFIAELGFARDIDQSGRGVFNTATHQTYRDYLNPGWNGNAECPTPARKLAEMTPGDVGKYVDSLYVGGETYHDIGMIWGGRLLSPTGLFAADNADVDGKRTSRHMIFLTDGLTAPQDISYSSYGIEPLDRRRWDPHAPAGGLTLKQVVERRFAVACKEVKKRNITVWVINFGVTVTPLMQQCAGPGHTFQADNAAQLSQTFSKIAKAMGDLRISK